MHKNSMKEYFLGIDPGTTTIGYAIISGDGRGFELVDYGVILTPKLIDAGAKLNEIRKDLLTIIEKYSFSGAGVEKLFFTKNITTGIAVAEARWVILELLYEHKIERCEFTPLQVKKNICGHGRAEKSQMQQAIMKLCELKEPPKPDDAADAIGIAYLTWIHFSRSSR